MTLNIDGYEKRVSKAVKSFWIVREREGIRSGKILNAFVDLLQWVVHNNGLPNSKVLTGKKAQIPGFFRPTKSWDLLIMDDNTLIAGH